MKLVLDTDDRDLKFMSLTVYGEARGEPLSGKIAVANVIKNRAIRRKQSIYDVVMAPYQFSCWLKNDPNRTILDGILKEFDLFASKDSYLRECIFACFGVLNNLIGDNTNGADHYVTRKLALSDKAPDWTKTFYLSAVVGNHMFYDSTRGR